MVRAAAYKGIIRIVRRLWDKQDLACLVILEMASCCILRDLSFSISVEHECSAWDVPELTILQNAEAHRGWTSSVAFSLGWLKYTLER